MKKRTALITGGMGGIGTAIARTMAQHGIQVAISYNRSGNHEQALLWQQEQKKEGFDFVMSYADITSFESAAEMIKNIEGQIGKIDILVNNAGVTEDTTLLKMSPDQWHKVINTNLNSIYNVTRNVVTSMIQNKYGRIINISSINGQKGQFGQTNYCAAKAGIHGFTKALAYELAKKGVTVNTISPGYVKTAMVEKMDQEVLDKIISQIPVGRFAAPEEIARMVYFLAADESGYITGSNFSINGGQHMY